MIPKTIVEHDKSGLEMVLDAMDELLEEIKYKAMVFNDLNGDERPVDSIYIGGGTPSILQTPDIKRIINC